MDVLKQVLRLVDLPEQLQINSNMDVLKQNDCGDFFKVKPRLIVTWMY